MRHHSYFIIERILNHKTSTEDSLEQIGNIFIEQKTVMSSFDWQTDI